MDLTFLFLLLPFLDRLRRSVRCKLSQWARPENASLMLGAVADATRTKRELVLENVMLRQQLVVLRRSVKRPRLKRRDRWVLTLLASKLRTWKSTLLIVKPETVLRWHRELFRWVWRRKSKAKMGRKPMSDEIVALIQQMARENHLWGAERIRGELLKLGIHVSKSTIQKYLKAVRPHGSGSQTWSTFLRNHAKDIWACDFLQTYDIFFRAVFVFVIIELESRRLVHFGITRHPTDAWVTQQLREATGFQQGPRYLIRDNDSKYGQAFSRVASGTGIEELRTPVGAPKANAVCERFLGSLRRECLDHVLLLSERHLHRVVTQYQNYYNQARPHQGIAQQIPCGTQPLGELPINGKVVSHPVLNGLHHDYRRTGPESLPRVA